RPRVASFPTRRSSDLRALDRQAIAEALGRLGEAAAEAVAEGVDELGEDRLLGREVDVEGAEGDAGAAGDLDDRRPFEADLAEDRSEEHTSELQSRENL